MPVSPRSEKFNIVNNDHGRTQKSDFLVSVGKTNFTDHHTPDAIKGFRDSVLVCKMHNCYCTICKNFEHFHSLSPSQQWPMVRLYENKLLQNDFERV